MSENVIPPVKNRFQWLRSLSVPMRILVVVVSFILLTFAADLFAAALNSLAEFGVMKGWSEPFSYDPGSPTNFGTSPDEQKQNLENDFADLNILERSITITSSAEEMQIAFRLVIPREDDHAATFTTSLRGGQAILTRVLFGELSVDGSLLTDADFEPSQWEVDPKTKSVIFTLRAVFADVDYPVGINFHSKSRDAIQPAVDKLLIETSAIGTSAVTLFSSQAMTFIGLTLKTFLPDVPAEFSATP